MIIGLYNNMKNFYSTIFGAIITLVILFFARPALAWNLQGACAGIPNEVNVGETVAWTASQTSTAQPGDGTHYEWHWSSNDNLSGTTQSVSKTYTTAGTKNATVIISLIISPNNLEKITRTCSIIVKTSPPPTPPSNPPSSGCLSNCGGGGVDQPTVVLFQKAVKAPLTFVYLSQIPYTGLSGTAKILLFVFGIALWSALVVWAMRSRKTAELAEQLVNNIRNRFSPSVTNFSDTLEITGDLLLNNQAPEANSELDALLAVEAKKERTLISPDGLKIITETATVKGEEPLATLGKTIENAKNKYQREDGWLLLNKEKVAESLSPTEKTIAVPTYGEKEELAKPGAEINTFVSLLARSDETGVATYLRTLRESGKSVERFIRAVIMEIDSAYRARLEGDNHRRNFVLSQIISRWSGEKTEEIIGVLFTVVDKNYKNPALGLKLAIMRIGELKE